MLVLFVVEPHRNVEVVLVYLQSSPSCATAIEVKQPVTIRRDPVEFLYCSSDCPFGEVMFTVFTGYRSPWNTKGESREKVEDTRHSNVDPDVGRNPHASPTRLCLNCYWVGSLDFNFLGYQGVFH